MTDWKYIKRDGIPTEPGTYRVAYAQDNGHRFTYCVRSERGDWQDDEFYGAYAWREENPEPPPLEPPEVKK